MIGYVLLDLVSNNNIWRQLIILAGLGIIGASHCFCIDMVFAAKDQVVDAASHPEDDNITSL